MSEDQRVKQPNWSALHSGKSPPLISVATLVAIKTGWHTPLIPELEGIIKQEETALSHSLILRFLEGESPFWTEVEIRESGWLFYFSDLQVEPQYLSLSFY